jgi:hypothetical protein
MSVRLSAVAVALLALTAGCASRATKYDWGKYDPSLYSYYRDPAKVAELSITLSAIITTADSKHRRVPPGIYAEYGYLQLQQGKAQEAVALFRQEEAHWPESKAFMEQMIRVASPPPAASTNRSAAQ